MPAALAKKIERAATFNQGFATVEYLASALVDMKLHLAGDRPIDPDAFERDTLAALGHAAADRRCATARRSSATSSAATATRPGYYSYLWSDTLTADAFEAFTEAGGPYDKTVAQRLREHVLSVGNTVDPGRGLPRVPRPRPPDPRADAEARLPRTGRAEHRAVGRP